MVHRHYIACAFFIAFISSGRPAATRAAELEPIDFNRDVAPILEQHCIRCHQSANKKGDLSLATRVDLDANELLSAGKPDESRLLDVITAAAGEKPEMPKEGEPLSKREVAIIRNWIAHGAEWPKDAIVKERSKADRNWWSLRPLGAATLSTDGIPQAWRENPIDVFIYTKLKVAGLSPNPPAERRALIRRVTYDLTGLPPTPAEVAAFIDDAASDAYERLVDRLLASPRYGEHVGRQWLDVARFGESTGFEVNHIIDNAWPYRDYVIRSMNDDKPFDRFVMEQLAADSLAPGDPSTEIALSFLACGPIDIVGNADAAQAAQIRADGIDEMIRTTGEAFLGLTIGCARCHDHKFDPVTQRDYYSLYATLAGVFHGDRPVAPEAQLREHAVKLAPLETQKRQLQEARAAQLKLAKERQNLADVDRQLADVDRQIAALPTPPMLPVGRFEQPAMEQFVFERGDAQRKGARVVPASMKTLADATKGFELPADAPEKSRRLALARWLVAVDNPLTPRVIANRIWFHRFGTGIVATPNDFGYMGVPPTHPELLDWLAKSLIDSGWHLKHLHRLIVLSQAYQQSGKYEENAGKIDADSRLLWRFPPRRLAAEEIRDSMLFASGQLDERMGGPGFRLYQYTRDNVASYTPLESFGPETYRRSVYHQNARASRIDLLSDFDAPDCAFSAARRVPTTTPAQALTLMNHSFTRTVAEALSERLKREAAEGSAAQVRLAFELLCGRSPSERESMAAVNLINRFGLRAFCRAMLNSNEFIYVN